MNEIMVTGWNDLHDILFKDWLNPKLGRYRAPHAFRGLSDANYQLQTTLMRLGGPYPKLEPHLLVNFRRYSGIEHVKYDSMWHWMSLGQHYGLPTRLLDWTYSPLIAMHFATADTQKFNVDGAIWVVDFSKTRAFLPNLLKDVAEEIDSPVFTIEALENAITGDTRTLNNLQEALKNLKSLSTSEFVAVMEPPSIDDRIRNQVGLFSFMSAPDICLDDWLAKQPTPGLWRKIIIPASLKGEIRDKLDQSNISERTLFPGLDGVSKWLARHFGTIKKEY
ncbi:MAG: FRG domain-containing protein [Candidatus Helarchaeota archaeon]|nr:FRG domain-containing protein [Candidatus Helarchaeota archaeon]